MERQPISGSRMRPCDVGAHVLRQKVLRGSTGAGAARGRETDRVRRLRARSDCASSHYVVNEAAALRDQAVKVAAKVREVGALEMARRDCTQRSAVRTNSNVRERVDGLRKLRHQRRHRHRVAGRRHVRGRQHEVVVIAKGLQGVRGERARSVPRGVLYS